MPRGRAGAGRGAEGPAGRLRGWRGGSGRGRAEHPPAGGRRRAGQLGRSESHTDSTSGGRGGFWPSELQEKALLVLSHLFCPPLRGRGKGEVPVKPNARSAAEVSEKDIFSRGLSIHSHLHEVWESVKLLPGSLAGLLAIHICPSVYPRLRAGHAYVSLRAKKIFWFLFSQVHEIVRMETFCLAHCSCLIL